MNWPLITKRATEQLQLTMIFNNDRILSSKTATSDKTPAMNYQQSLTYPKVGEGWEREVKIVVQKAVLI